MATLLLLTHYERAKALIRWAARLTDPRTGPLMVLCCFAGQPIRPMTAVATEQLANSEKLIKTAKSAMNELGLSSAALWELKHPDIVTAVLHEIENRQIDLVIMGADSRFGPEDPKNQVGKKLLHGSPVDTLLIDPGEEDREVLERIIVPMEGAFVPATLKAASSMVQKSAVVVPLLVGPEFGVDSRVVARRELNLKLQELEGIDTRKFIPEVVIADRALDGIVRASRNCDMVLFSASSDKVLYELKGAWDETDTEKEGHQCAVGLFKSAGGKAAGIRRALLGQASHWLPHLIPTDRVKIFDRLQSGAGINADFLMMMGLSTAIACLGLLQGSTAVIIGAMLVAPLMTPLIAAGFALVQGNVRLFRKSMTSMGMGILSSLLVSLVIGLFAPKDDLTLEVVARASPDILDLFIALFSGMAAAYAFARPSLMGTLAGVAIAAALVPPLAAVGIGLSRGIVLVAKGAAILHLTNVVAITFGAAIIFRLLGVQGTRLGAGLNLGIRRAIIVMILIFIILLTPLGFQTASKLSEGQPRPMAFPLSEKLSRNLFQRVIKEPDTDIILAGRSTFIEGGPEVGILLSSEHPVSPTLIWDLRHIIRKELGDDTKVWIHTLQRSQVPKGGDKKGIK